MLLPFAEGLISTSRVDDEMRQLADRHYSRQTVGHREFVGPGRSLVLRDTGGNVLFAWRWELYRLDDQTGYNCAIFRNESHRLSSDIILEAERCAVDVWGPNRFYTYVDPRKVMSENPGYCFKVAGWKFLRLSLEGKHLLVKEDRCA